MNPAFVNALTVASIAALGVVGMFCLKADAHDIALAAVSVLGGYLGGVATSKGAP